jgi:hypothetical protein
MARKKAYYEEYHYNCMHGMQAEELYLDQEQKNDAEPLGTEKILQVLSCPQTAQGNQITCASYGDHFLSTGQ